VRRPRRRISRGPRCLVIALDGVSLGDMEAAAANGDAPTIRDLMGRAGALSVQPSLPSSAAATWSTFMTASNPGRHSRFGFLSPGPDYLPRLADADALRMPTLWDRIAVDGYRSVVINLPATYPARRVSGVLVAGVVAPDLSRACHPPRLAERLARVDYATDLDVPSASDQAAFLERLREALAVRIRVMEELLAEQGWSLAVLGFTEGDRLNHLWFDRVHDRDDPAGVAFAGWVGEVDGLLARLLDRYPGAMTMIVANHGAGPLRRLCNVDRWLEENGFLLRTESGAVSPDSAAFSLEGDRIYLNATRIFPQGKLRDGSVAPTVGEIATGLTELVDPQTGERPLRAVVRRAALYRGPYYRTSPHLLLSPATGYELKSSARLPLFADAVALRGTHVAEGGFALIGLGRTVAPGSVGLEDLGATVLGWLGALAPDIDGKPLA
jgi:predicted AlkP superfamily phosphohydrolase/phosphomutase